MYRNKVSALPYWADSAVLRSLRALAPLVSAFILDVSNHRFIFAKCWLISLNYMYMYIVVCGLLIQLLQGY